MDSVLSPNANSSMDTSEFLVSTPLASSAEEAFSTEEQQVDYSGHLFYGPGENVQDRSLHSLRAIKHQPVEFYSTPSKIQNVGWKDLQMGNTNARRIQVVFEHSEKLGFGLKKDNHRIVVEYVNESSVAAKAGVLEMDILLSLNETAIDNEDMEDVVKMMNDAKGGTMVIVFLRMEQVLSDGDDKKIVLDKAKSVGGVSQTVKGGGILARAKTLTKGSTTLNKLQNAKNFVGNAMFGNTKSAKIVHLNTTCEGCHVSPIIGGLWTCSVCVDVSLCDGCYSAGLHGMEGTDGMATIHDHRAQEKLKKKCKSFTTPLLVSLRRDICKNNIGKFEYMGNWLADVIGTTPAHKITIRGIEVSQLSQEARQHFVDMLRPLATNRNDIDIYIEWLQDSTLPDLEKLRIWISDKQSRTECPFKDKPNSE